MDQSRTTLPLTLRATGRATAATLLEVAETLTATRVVWQAREAIVVDGDAVATGERGAGARVEERECTSVNRGSLGFLSIRKQHGSEVLLTLSGVYSEAEVAASREGGSSGARLPPPPRPCGTSWRARTPEAKKDSRQI